MVNQEKTNYDALGIDPPEIAYERARQNIGKYWRGTWRKRWWHHPIEAKAAEAVGCFLMRNPISSTRQAYTDHYNRLAKEVAGGRYFASHSMLNNPNALPPSVIKERCAILKASLGPGGRNG